VDDPPFDFCTCILFAKRDLGGRGSHAAGHDKLDLGLSRWVVMAADEIRSRLHTLEQVRPPETVEAWGQWIASAGAAGTTIEPASDEFRNLLLAVDESVDADLNLGRYLSQFAPLARDLRLAESEAVRIMTMAGSKGLTVRAAILVGVEEGIVPRPGKDLSEERRLLYVAMTRARQFLFCTWAKRRGGPTARAGYPGVGVLRNHSSFLNAGPIRSQNGESFVAERWQQQSKAAPK